MSDLRKAAEEVLERWDSPAWEWIKQGPTAELMATLRAALAAPCLEVTVDPRLTPDEAAAISSALAAPSEDIETLRRENERLREALGKYGRHLDGCAVTLGGYQCTCGFNQQEVPK